FSSWAPRISRSSSPRPGVSWASRALYAASGDSHASQGDGRMPKVPVLGLAGLSVAFGGLRAVDGVTLAVAPGERRALIGPNGAGKTTLFTLIGGELKPAAGEIMLFGQDVTRLAPERRARRGLARTYQVNTLFPSLTVIENLLLAVQGRERRRLVLHRPV